MDHFFALPKPAFDSELTSLLFEIERYRANIGVGTTPREIYFELHALFDLVMSVVSARIEGNHTTIYEALDNPEQNLSSAPGEQFKEIINIRKASRFIDDLDPEHPLTHKLIRDLHYQTVAELTSEGDPTPGSYREREVAITASQHKPPSWVNVHALMSSLFEFSNKELPLQEQILQIALAHHRFVWIHPFHNGNGRVSRLFTYAMLRRTIFSDRGAAALNPTSVFGNDREEYISALKVADDLSLDGVTVWATFFARGIRDDLIRVSQLQDRDFVSTQLIQPSIDGLNYDGIIGTQTKEVLELVLEHIVIRAGDLEPILQGSASARSRIIRDLRERKLLRTSNRGPRFYELSLSSGPLAHRIVQKLNDLGYLPPLLSND